MGLHTGEPAVGDEGYTGLDVVRAARIAAVGTGGQVLLSETTRAIVGDSLPAGVEIVALGKQRLKDIDRLEPLYALRIPGVVTDDAPAAPQPAGKGSAYGVSEVLAGIPAWLRDLTAPIAHETREVIEQRVLAELQKSLGTPGAPRTPGLPASISSPPRESTPSIADEITKLQALRDAGAITDEQYRRAVDEVLKPKGE